MPRQTTIDRPAVEPRRERRRAQPTRELKTSAAEMENRRKVEMVRAATAQIRRQIEEGERVFSAERSPADKEPRLTYIEGVGMRAVDHAREAALKTEAILPIKDTRTLTAEAQRIMADLDREAMTMRASMSPDERMAFDATVANFEVPPLTELTPQEEQNLFAMPNFDEKQSGQDSTPDIRGWTKAELDAALKEVPTKRTTPLKVPAYMKNMDHAWGARPAPVKTEGKIPDVPGFTPSEKPPIRQTRFQKWRDVFYRIASKI